MGPASAGWLPHCSPKHPDLLCRRQAGGSGSVCHQWSQLAAAQDVGRAVDFGVAYDQGANRVLVDTSSPYTEESAVSAPSGVVTVPQSDEPLRLKEGDKVLCDDGTTYEITDLKLWESPAPLPTPTCDWNQFPELEVPEVKVLRFQSQTGDRLHILNLYETRRMLYTLYNAVPNCPDLWEAGTLKLNSKGDPILRLSLGITESAVCRRSGLGRTNSSPAYSPPQWPGLRWRHGMSIKCRKYLYRIQCNGHVTNHSKNSKTICYRSETANQAVSGVSY